VVIAALAAPTTARTIKVATANVNIFFIIFLRSFIGQGKERLIR
jgi:hypothetical protein